MSRSKADLMRNREALTRSAGRTALFGTTEDHEYLVLDLDQIEPSPTQPRRHFDEATLQELANSIAERGVLQPILVRETRRDRFEIIAGERRWRASSLAGKSQIPALAIRTEDAALLAVLENLQREDLDAVETAQALGVLIRHYKATHEQLGRIIGKSQTYVTRALRILDLPQRVLDEYPQNRHVPMTMLMEIASLEDEGARLALWTRAKQGLSVAAARQAKQGRTLSADPGASVVRTSNRFTKELASLRAKGATLGERQKEPLRRLRAEIDALLGG